MERADRAPVAGVFCSSASTARAGAPIELGADAAQHVRVRRMRAGDALRVHDGAGRVAWGTLASVERRGATVGVERVEEAPRPAPIHLLVPVADRDRMLWLAEKAVELGLASWRPVRWARSRSVAGRGEGAGFTEKLRARMAAAVVQSEGAWLPELHADAAPDAALAALPNATRVLLEPGAAPLGRAGVQAPLVLALGPEGGFAPEERDRLGDAGFHPASLGGNILRFETAGVAALAVVSLLLVPAEAATHDRP